MLIFASQYEHCIMDMEPEAQQAWDIIEKTRANLFLTGKAGTGKTTFLRELKRRSPKRMVVLAPTGIAAINAGGVTIHSFFQLPLSPYLPGTTFGGREQRRYQFSKQKRNIIRTMDLLVIDEISMVRSDLLDAVDSVMRRYRQHNLPFGGVQLLMIGDLGQLAPVTTADEEQLLRQYYDSPYFFSSNALQQAGYLTVELKKVFRQQDAAFISLLNQIRDNHATRETLNRINERYIPGFVPERGSDYIQLTTHNRQAQSINEAELRAINAPLQRFAAEVEGTFPETSFPADQVLTLKRGAQVMFIKNAPDHRFYNGMLGEVTDIFDGTITVRSKDTGESIALERMEWTNAKYTLNEQTKEIEETVEGTFRQYPVRLAWAITIHKSQGLTFNHAIIDASRSFSHGQTYVALSRCRSLEGMVLSQPLSPSAIIGDETVDQFTHQLQPPTDTQITELEQLCTLQTIAELFCLRSVEESMNHFRRTLEEFFQHRNPKLVEAYRQTTNTFAELHDVAEKFRVQYTRMLNDAGTVADAALQDRIHKGSAYFLSKAMPLLTLVRQTTLSTDNKIAQKQLSDRLPTLREELEVKCQLLDYEQTATFTVTDYMKRKAQFLLGQADEAGTSARAKKKKEPKTKEPKTPTREITLNMYRQGMAIDLIAHERSLTTSTILGHLLPYIKEGQIDCRQFVSEEHERALTAYLAQHPDVTSWSAIRAAMGNDYTYDEIRLVTALTGHYHHAAKENDKK